MKKFSVEVAGESFVVKLEKIESESSSLVSDSEEIDKSQSEAKLSNSQSGQVAENQVTDEKDNIFQDSSQSEEILAPMPGSILEIKAQEGKSVSQGDKLIVLEAMKMENEILADRAGTIQKIKVKVGENVNADDVLLIIR